MPVVRNTPTVLDEINCNIEDARPYFHNVATTTELGLLTHIIWYLGLALIKAIFHIAVMIEEGSAPKER